MKEVTSYEVLMALIHGGIVGMLIFLVVVVNEFIKIRDRKGK